MAETVHVSFEQFHARVLAACRRAGLGATPATHIADSLAEAESAGRASHGLLRVEYICREAAKLQPTEVTTTVEGPAFLGLDGQRHMGYHPGVIGLQRGVAKAGEAGLCLVGIRNSGHSGMLGFYARRIAAAGCWGLAMAHCCPLMAPHGGGASVFGTNPIALGVPRAGASDDLVIDFSPAAYTYGAVRMDQQLGRQCPPGAALTRDGTPSTDPSAILDGGTLLPAAGPKGSALAMLIQLICGPLLGADAVPAMAGSYGLCFLILRADLFQDANATGAAVEHLVAAVSGCPKAPGFDELRLPGERAAAAIASARSQGLDVDAKLWAAAGRLAAATD